VRDVPSGQPGRFHDHASPPTQYFCLHRFDLPDDSPELSFSSAGDAGLSAEELISDDYRATQALADRLRSAGTVGFVTPSAAPPGTANVVLLGERVAISYNDDPIEPWELASSMTVSTGTAPESLFPLVRRFGHPHPALDAWLRGDEYRFAEPDWAAEG
jgi:hypothetical protein